MARSALEAWARIVGRLVRRGEWEPLYVPMAAAASVQCAMYVELSGIPELAGECEETRRIARAFLQEMCYLGPGRASVGLLDQAGRDIELLAVCAPLEPATSSPS